MGKARDEVCRIGLKVNAEPKLSQREAIGGIENDTRAAGNNGWGGLRERGDDLGLALAKIGFPALGKDLRNGALGGLDNFFVGIGEGQRELLGKKGAHGAFAGTTQTKQPKVGGPCHRMRLTERGLLGECGSRFLGLGRGPFWGRIERWQTHSAIYIG